MLARTDRAHGALVSLRADSGGVEIVMQHQLIDSAAMLCALKRLAPAPRLSLALLLLPWIAPVHAALGEDAGSVVADSATLQGAVHTTGLLHYDVHEIAGAGPLRVREFATRDGRIFAVSWSGPAPPALQNLLGSYFSRYSNAVAAMEHPGLHRSVRVVQSDLVVESGGHLRAYVGRAYLPALLPSGACSNSSAATRWNSSSPCPGSVRRASRMRGTCTSRSRIDCASEASIRPCGLR
jgi:hypothetical protein